MRKSRRFKKGEVLASGLAAVRGDAAAWLSGLSESTWGLLASAAHKALLWHPSVYVVFNSAKEKKKLDLAVAIEGDSGAASQRFTKMVRLREGPRFTIFEDSGLPTPEPENTDPSDGNEAKWGTAGASLTQTYHPLTRTKSDVRQKEDADVGSDVDDADDERRQSSFTTSSISTFPESVYQTDYERGSPRGRIQPSSTVKPSFRRAESVRRLQLVSPTHTPRHSRLNSLGAETPRSIRSAQRTGSPTARRQRPKNGCLQHDVGDKQCPLVLLHVSLLPVTLPWSEESLHELLPESTLNNLRLLRSKLSDPVLKRGILIPHPCEEFETLEERLLEALELTEQRVTKCGHFTARRRSTSGVSASGTEDKDSALGSSTDESEEERCTTCGNCLKTSRSGVGSKGSKWVIKVFAANGLMRSSAWTAAWNEMERVDVEVLPWISETVRRQLDQRKEEEDVDEEEARQVEERRIKAIVEEQVRLAYEERKKADASDPRIGEANNPRDLVLMQEAREDEGSTPTPPLDKTNPTSKTQAAELPHIYRPDQIPLSTLLRNYVYLLAQDRRNIAIFFSILFAVSFALRAWAATSLGPGGGLLGPEPLPPNRAVGKLFADANETLIRILPSSGDNSKVEIDAQAGNGQSNIPETNLTNQESTSVSKAPTANSSSARSSVASMFWANDEKRWTTNQEADQPTASGAHGLMQCPVFELGQLHVQQCFSDRVTG